MTNNLTTKAVFELVSKVNNKIPGLTPDEINLVKTLVEEKAQKMKTQLRKNLIKYIDHYLSEDGNSDRDTVKDLIKSLEIENLSKLFGSKKTPANGEIIYQDFSEFLSNCNCSTTIKDLRESVI
jgi:hypothetical protein